MHLDVPELVSISPGPTSRICTEHTVLVACQHMRLQVGRCVNSTARRWGQQFLTELFISGMSDDVP